MVVTATCSVDLVMVVEFPRINMYMKTVASLTCINCVRAVHLRCHLIGSSEEVFRERAPAVSSRDPLLSSTEWHHLTSVQVRDHGALQDGLKERERVCVCTCEQSERK